MTPDGLLDWIKTAAPGARVVYATEHTHTNVDLFRIVRTYVNRGWLSAHLRRIDEHRLEYIAVRKKNENFDQKIVAAMRRQASHLKSSPGLKMLREIAADFGISAGDCRTILTRHGIAPRNQ